LKKLELQPAAADEALQRLREKLLLPRDGAPPRIADYSGRGPLGSFLRVSAVRVALSRKRLEGKRPASDEALAQVIPPSADVELDYIKLRSREVFAEAFAHALSSLAPKERNLLRLHYVEGLNIERIGALEGVHRATVARRLHACREAMLAATRERLRRKLRLQSHEVDSLFRLVASRFELSLRRALR
jgi:RNA polymerase sigma-70 factor (ECF subfamily)